MNERVRFIIHVIGEDGDLCRISCEDIRKKYKDMMKKQFWWLL